MSVVELRAFDFTKSIVMRQKPGFHVVVQIVLTSPKASTRCARRFIEKVSMGLIISKR